MKLKKYLKNLPVTERDDFASRCNTTFGHLRNVAYGYKPCGEGLCINIERESSGAIKCEDLRPDVDWAYLRGTGSEEAA
ncbi:YdaS family helix-turn-helix protein [Nitrosomonas ureae]|uniref:Antitoxin of toxin-antitoxin system, YdaS/YdaT n=1 Tax=Nitrosomonas ureae TaxID=44577 RepID=A0A286A241_9PROT|nr:YdaS family helix-turn-helix protein [Nitrosomonas ureae]SOD15979.1 Putative antitoxin of toxin-antitoxin system, YdaS/YdaT [Nitrosomonas ureae]